MKRLFGTTRGRVLTFLLVCSVPTMGLALSDAFTNHRRQAMVVAERAALVREAAIGNVIVAIEGAHQMLATLATSAVMQSGQDCAAPLQAIVDAMGERYTAILLVEPDGMLRCSSRLMAGAPTDLSAMPFFLEAQARGEFVVSRIVAGPVTGIANLGVGMPAVAGPDKPASGAPIFGVGIRSDFLLRAGQNLPSSAATAIWIIDEADVSLPLTQAASSGALPDITTAERLWTLPGQLLRGASRDGRGFTFAAGAVADDLRLIVALPDAEWVGAADAAFRRRVIELAAILIVSFFAVVGALNLSVVGPIQQLARRVRAWNEKSGPFVPGNVNRAPAEVQALADSFAAATRSLAARQAAQEEALRQREAMLAETHHRVKNNLQIVASLLNLQSDRESDPAVRAHFLAAGTRIRTLSIVHRHLYQHGDPSVVELRPFLEDVARQALNRMGERNEERIALAVNGPEVLLPADAALPLGLIVNELVGNAATHAFSDGAQGRISVQVDRDPEDDSRMRVTVEDDGSGRGPDAIGPEAEKAGGLGMRLVRALSRQLGATLEIEPAAPRGTLARLAFPLAQERQGPR